jgi:hypothetical protein
VRAAGGAALGAALIIRPGATLTVLVVIAGLLLLLGAVSEALALTYPPVPGETPRPAPPRAPRRRLPPGLRITGVATILLLACAGAAALAAGSSPQAPRLGRCNGYAELCDRPLDRVAFAGTHNSMAADGEPGWLFAAQDAGIQAQLQAGIRALLIDTHYGFPTARGVASELAPGSKSRDKAVAGLGEQVVRTAERLRSRIGYRGGGRREVFLCHGFCEVGATNAVDALAGVHRFLVTHPDEVVILSIEDDTSAADTASVIRASGLSREVYLGPARRPWPTLRELIERDERVLVLVENHPGDVAWLHYQPSVAQETPYTFTSVNALEAPSSCRPNRGGTGGSLLLVNHWVDTTPAPRPSNARLANAASLLEGRLRRCEQVRGRLPNVVAVDFFGQGDVLKAVDVLNGVA